MARIRSVKPETWSDQKLARVSRDARLLYISLWNFADEQGRMVGDPRQVKGMCLPMDDDLSPVEIDLLLDELAKAGRVQRYIVDDEHFLHLPHLSKHQRLDTAQESRFPEPPEHDPAPPPQNPAPTAGKSGEVRGESGQVQGDPREVQPRARAYVAGSREHVASSRLKPVVALAAPARPDSEDIRAVFDAWRATLPSGSRPKLTEARRDAVKTALARYPLQDCEDAARGWVNDPWPERAQQNDLAQLLHMGSKRKPQNVLEKMRDLWRHPPPAVLGKATAQARATYLAMTGGDGDGVAGVGPDHGQAQRKLPRPAG